MAVVGDVRFESRSGFWLSYITFILLPHFVEANSRIPQVLCYLSCMIIFSFHAKLDNLSI